MRPSSRTDIRNRQCELWLVCHVEDFGAELHRACFRDTEGLHRRRSTFARPCPRPIFRPALPKWPVCVTGFSRWKVLRLIHCDIVCGPEFGSPTRFWRLAK